MVLRFDVDACMKALLEKIIQLADALIAEMYADSVEEMTPGEKGTVDVDYAAYADGRIRAQITYGALAIMRSYGRGSGMDMDNPALETYMKSNMWNPARTSNKIVGRESGPYQNIFGEKVISKGRFAGQDLEYMVKPIVATNSIKKMEQRYISNQYTKVDSEFQRVVKEFLENEMHKFFYNTGG